MLTAMGFSERQATGALAACQGSVERAADWLFSHMDDLDAAVEAALTGGAQPGGAAAGGVAGERLQGSAAAEAVQEARAGRLRVLGLLQPAPVRQAEGCGGLEALLVVPCPPHCFNPPPTTPLPPTHTTNLPCRAAGGDAGSAAGGQMKDGPGEYELVGFISHMGANTACGHYVAHIKKVRWRPRGGGLCVYVG